MTDQARLIEVLEGLATAARIFTSQAEYTVERAVEEELVDALDDAERLLCSLEGS